MNEDTVPQKIQDDFIAKSNLYDKTNFLGKAITDWAYLNLHSLAGFVVAGSNDLHESDDFNLGGDFIKYVSQNLNLCGARYEHNQNNSPFVLYGLDVQDVVSGEHNLTKEQEEAFDDYYRLITGANERSVKEFKELCERELSICFWKCVFNLNEAQAENAPVVKGLINAGDLTQIKNCLDDVAAKFAAERVVLARHAAVPAMLSAPRRTINGLDELGEKIEKQIKKSYLKDYLRRGKIFAALKSRKQDEITNE